MTVTVTQNGYLVLLSGTIAEVLAEIVDQNVTKIVSWTDDLTNARALCSRLKF
jgi:predicted naringenin-chalcone synthase